MGSFFEYTIKLCVAVTIYVLFNLLVSAEPNDLQFMTFLIMVIGGEIYTELNNDS